MVGGGTNLYFLSSARQTAGLAPGVFWTLALRRLGPHLRRDQVYMAGKVGRVLRMRRQQILLVGLVLRRDIGAAQKRDEISSERRPRDEMTD